MTGPAPRTIGLRVLIPGLLAAVLWSAVSCVFLMHFPKLVEQLVPYQGSAFVILPWPTRLVLHFAQPQMTLAAIVVVFALILACLFGRLSKAAWVLVLAAVMTVGFSYAALRIPLDKIEEARRAEPPRMTQPPAPYYWGNGNE